MSRRSWGSGRPHSTSNRRRIRPPTGRCGSGCSSTSRACSPAMTGTSATRTRVRLSSSPATAPVRSAVAAATRSPLGPLLAGVARGGTGFVGDDGAPVPGTDMVAACDAILPSMVEHDPEWAGWCGVLVNLNDLAAMGATPVGLLDALGARDAAHAARVLHGLRRACMAYDVRRLGGHTQLGVPASLS